MDITKEIIEQFEEIRASGKCNMYDAKAVIKELNKRGYSEACDFVINDTGNISLGKYMAVIDALGDYMKNKENEMDLIIYHLFKVTLEDNTEHDVISDSDDLIAVAKKSEISWKMKVTKIEYIGMPQIFYI